MTVDFNLYLITDRHQVPGGDLIAAVRAALEGGVRAVQLREKDLPPRELLPLALALRDLTRCYGARLLINDRVDVALAVGADGVHLGGGSLPPSVARKLLGPDCLIGVSTHCLPEALAAREGGADFITFGPVWFTPSKAPYGPPVGLQHLREACAVVDIPVFTLGGVKIENVPELLAAGAAGAALISGVLAAPCPKEAASAFLHLLNGG